MDRRLLILFLVFWIPAVASAQVFHPAFLRSPPALKATFQDARTSDVNALNYNFTTVPLGAEFANRTVLVGITARAGAAARNVNAVTVGGVNANALIEIDRVTGATDSLIAFYYVRVPTGTSGDVLVTFSSTMARAGIVVWTLENLRSTSLRQTLELSTVDTGTIDASAGGCLFGLKFWHEATSTTWAGLTEASDLRFTDDPVDVNITSAAECFAADQASRAITTTPATPATADVTIGLVISIR